MKKKSLSILLGFCMIFTLLSLSLPVSAAEDRPTNIYVAGPGPNGAVNAITSPAEDLPEGLSYDSNTNTLTLDNVNITEYIKLNTYAAIIVQGSSNLTIRLIGNNAIRVNSECFFGIYLNGDASQQLVITGDGSLVVDGSSSAAIKTQGKLIIDSSVSLLAGFGEMYDGFLDAVGGITVGGEAYTGNAKEGAVVNGKVIDKVRKTKLNLSAESVSYGAKGVLNPKTQSVTVEETGEGWGWNHRTKTLTLSGAVIYNQTPLSSGSFDSALIFTTGWMESRHTLELTEGTANAVIMGEIVGDNTLGSIHGTRAWDLKIMGGGSLTSVGGVNTSYESGRGHGINSNSLDISGSCSVTSIGSNVISESCGIMGTIIDISDSTKVLSLGGRSSYTLGIYQYNNKRIRISGDALVEARGGSGKNSKGIYARFGNMVIDGGTVKAVGGQYGLQVSSSMLVTGGSLTAIGGNASFYSAFNASFNVAPAQKSLGVYAGDAAPGSKIALVAAPDTHTLTGEQLASKYMHIAYEPLNTPDEGPDIKAYYTAGQPKQVVYSIDLTWGVMTFEYVDGDVAGTWDPVTHEYEGRRESGWHYAEGENEINLTNHSNIGLDVAFAFVPGDGFEAVTGSFAGAGIADGKATLASGEDTTPQKPASVTAALTLSGSLPAGTSGVIGRATVTIDAAAIDAKE